MRALVLTEHGGMDQLRPAEVSVPAIAAPDEVLIRVRTAAINHLDLSLLEGLKGVTLSFPHVVGTDAAGVVDAVGQGVSAFQPGDRVFVNPGIACNTCPVCQAGEDPYCREFGILGEHRPGTVAEYVVVPERNLGRVPEPMPWDQAAAFPLSTLTAWRMLTTRAAVRPGETVLIWGAGGGVSLAALQIARHLGARTVVTSSSDRKLAKAQELGADVRLNHAALGADGVAKEVRKLTGTGTDVVVDSVGESTWDASLRSLRPGGRLVTCGATTGPIVPLDLRRLFWFQWSLIGSTMGNRREFAEIVALAHQGKLWPVVDSVVPLAEGAAAYARMARGEQLGKLVIEVSK